MLLEVDKNGLTATFAVSQELNSGHVHGHISIFGDSIAPRSLLPSIVELCRGPANSLDLALRWWTVGRKAQWGQTPILRGMKPFNTASKTSTVAAMKTRLMGRVKNTEGSPRERSIARRRCSSISGPRT